MSTQTVSVSLPSEVIYVSGTVNAVPKTWTLVDDAWQTTADRADDETYIVALTAVTAAGNSASYELTLYYGVLNLITDRTAADVARVQTLAAKNYAAMTDAEKAEWDADMKGAYNASDLNRVGAAVDYVAGRFREQGYAAEVTPRTNWTESDTPTQSDMSQYLGNVKSLRSKIAVKPTTPKLPTDMTGLDYEGANAIEQTLLDLDALLTNTEKAWFYSGELYAGEV